MEFKNSHILFDKKNRFSGNMSRFVCDEAARFTLKGNEAASASIDEMVERGFRFSQEKSKGKIKEHKKNLLEIKAKKEEILSGDSIHQSKVKSDSSRDANAKRVKELNSKYK